MAEFTDLPFNAGELGEPTEEFVVWMDVMGIQVALKRSVKVAANFVYKIHHAALKFADPITLYPVMDGIYACATERATIEAFLSFVFRSVAKEFVQCVRLDFRFMVRAAVAHGAVYHGANLSKKASWTLGQHPEYRQQILLGMPMVHAHLGEPEAPPFGVYVDESAVGFASGPYPFDVWWRWYSEADADLVASLRTELSSYYDNCTQEAAASGYDVSRIRIHRGQASLYLRDG